MRSRLNIARPEGGCSPAEGYYERCEDSPTRLRDPTPSLCFLQQTNFRGNSPIGSSNDSHLEGKFSYVRSERLPKSSGDVFAGAMNRLLPPPTGGSTLMVSGTMIPTDFWYYTLRLGDK